MQAAELLAALRSAHCRLAIVGEEVGVVGPVPPELRPRVLALAPRLRRLPGDRWWQDLATWPPWRRESFEGARARRLAAGDTPEAAARWAFLETAELPAPAPPAPEAFGAPELPPGIDLADPVAVDLLAQADVEPAPHGAPPEPDAQRWRACLLAWPGADRSGWWFRYQHHQAAGLSAPRAQRRAFLELCETRLVLGLDVDAPAPESAERLDLPPSCQAEYFEEAPCRRNHGPFRECPGLVNRERDQLGGTRLPPELRPAVWLDVPAEAVSP